MKELARKTFENHPGLDAVFMTADGQAFNAATHRNAAYAHAARKHQPEPLLFTRSEVFTPVEPVAETPAEPVTETPAEPVTETPGTTTDAGNTTEPGNKGKKN